MRRHSNTAILPVLVFAALLALSGAWGIGCGDGGGNGNGNDNASDLCGNGVLDTGERCDDGNRSNGDGCSRHCLEECGGDVCSVGETCCENSDVTECRALGVPCPQ